MALILSLDFDFFNRSPFLYAFTVTNYFFMEYFLSTPVKLTVIDWWVVLE